MRSPPPVNGRISTKSRMVHACVAHIGHCLGPAQWVLSHWSARSARAAFSAGLPAIGSVGGSDRMLSLELHGPALRQEPPFLAGRSSCLSLRPLVAAPPPVLLVGAESLLRGAAGQGLRSDRVRCRRRR